MSLCPACGVSTTIEDGRCAKCGAPRSERHRGMTLVVIGVAGGVAAVVLVFAMLFVAIPNLKNASARGNETGAIGALRTINMAETLVRERGVGGENRYATLAELGGAGQALIDSVLASGTKQGYVFDVRVSPSEPDSQWAATASPLVPGTTGQRYFCCDPEGVIYCRLDRPFELTAEAKLVLEGANPVGR